MKRILSLILLVAMLLTSMLSILAGAETGSEQKGELSISYANVEFDTTVYLLIAVDYSDLYADAETAKANITLSVDGKTLTADESVMATSNFPANAVGFKYTELGAKNMGDLLAIQAYDNGVASGEAKTYSILEYAIKTRVEKSDNSLLMTAIDKMLEFGAEAQKAFLPEGETLESAYDHVLADDNGLIDYGLVVINGAETKKEIRKAGEVYVPTTAKVSPLLYDMDFNAVKDNSIAVTKGVQRYFYISGSDRTPFSFDVSSSTLNGLSGSYASSTVRKDIYTLGNNDASLAKPADSDTNVYSDHIIQLVKNGSGKGISLVTDSDGSNVAIKLARSGANIIYKTRLLNASSETNKEILGDVFTFSLTIGKSGTDAMCKTGYRFRGDGSKTIALFSITDSGTLAVINSAVTADTVAKIKGAEGECNFVTLHIVVNVKEGTLTYYSGSNSAPIVTVSSPNLTDYIYSTANKNYGDILDFTFENDGTVLIQKTMYTKGNIFE